MFAYEPAVLTNMRRSPYTSKFSAVLLSSLLAVAIGSASQSSHNLRDPWHGIPPAGADKEPHETGGAMLSHERSRGAASPKAKRLDTGNPVSLHSNALQFGPHADIKFPHPIPLPLYFAGYFDKQKDATGREAQPKDVDRAGSPIKPQESFRRKRSMDSIIKDNKGDNGDHPLPGEPGAQVHCWNEVHVFDFILPASEVAIHFPHECQHPLSCNTTCVAKVSGRDVCARLKSECTEPILNAVPETQLGTAQNENKQLASFAKNVERRLGELDAKLAQLSLESTYHKDKLVELGHSLNHLSDASKEQLSAASVKTLDSLDRKAAEMKALFDEKSKSMMTAISSVLSLVQSDSKTHRWTLKGYEEKKAEAIKDGSSLKMIERVYIGRYLMSWGIYFIKISDGVFPHLAFQLHKGISDEFLEWPFSSEVKLSIIHPESGEKHELREKPYITAKNIEFFSRPLEGSTRASFFGLIKFDSNYLERNGYIKNDQLLLKFEMLS